MFNRTFVRVLKKIQNQKCCDNFIFKETKNVFFKRGLVSAVNIKQAFDLPPEEIQPIFTITPEIVKDITTFKLCNEFPDLKTRATSILEYPSKIGELETCLTTIVAYKILENPRILTQEKINFAYLLGWLTEMVQGTFFMQRDAIDDVKTRNKTKAWHTINLESCFQTINDAVILESSIFLILKKYFNKHANYIKILDLFHETLYNSLQGHNLEIISKDVDKFDMELLESIAKYKIAPGDCILPVLSAWYLTSKPEPKNLEEIYKTLNGIALFKKIQADYLDSFGENPENLNVTHGTCSWLAVKSLEKASEKQRIVLKDNYGNVEKNKSAAINEINALYRELNLSAEFESFRNGHINSLKEEINEISDENLRKVFFKILNSNFQIKSE